ncbi:FtsX-like permease family protein [Ekhidna sp.]|uniref:FtsX-like permease family protein n=1 Tax=Ekhidna sp. TaxID=2608089 RepID=UPI003298835E
MLKNFLITSVRTLTRNKVYFFLGTLGLSLGISCVIAIYTIINFQSNFDQHQEHYDDIYRIIGTYQIGNDEGKTSTVPHPLSQALKPELSRVVAITNTFLLSDQINIPEADNQLKKLKQERIGFVYHEIFDILTFEWIAGQTNEDNPNATYLSASTARKFFGNDGTLESFIGRTIVLANKHNLVVTGIYKDLPRNTDFPFEMMVYYDKQDGVNPYFGEGKIWGRLNGGTQNLLRLDKNTDPIVFENSLKDAYVKFNQIEGYDLELQPLANVHFEPIGNYSGISFEPKYTTISYAIAILLAIIGSINFINLTTARALKRAREVGIRKVMGGQRIDLIAQFILETFVIVLISLGVGFVLASQILILFNTMLGTTLELTSVVLNDWIIFSIIILVSMTILSGLYPALVLSKFSALSAIKIKISNIDKQSKIPMRKLLVGVQFGFSIMMIMGAIIIFSQIKYMKNYDMGFDSDNIITLQFPEPDPDKQKRLKGQLDALPEIEATSLHLGSPMANTNNTDKFFNPLIGNEETFTVNSKSIDENYVNLFGLELISGRDLNSNDSNENILLTEIGLSKFNLGNAHDAVGMELEATWGGKKKIVGVIKDFNARSLKSELMPVMLSYEPQGYYELAFKVSKTADPVETLAKVETIWDQTYPELLIEYSFLDERIASRYKFEEVIGKSISFFVIVALIISILGLYGLTDYMANAKRKEIGIRKVVGAEIHQILRLFAKEVMLLLIIAFAISATGSYWLMKGWLEGFEYHITIGWEIITTALVVTGIVTTLTMGSRSISAARLNPVDVLKDE